MPPKLKCYTKPKKDGGTYTTCLEGQKKPKKLKIKKPIEKKKPKKLKILKPIEKKKPLTEKELLEKHGKFLGEHQKKEKVKAEAKKEKIDYDEVEQSNSLLRGGIYDFSDFFTYSEERVSTEVAQELAIHRSSVRMNKYITKALKKVAKQKKIKSTNEYIKFLDTIKTGVQMRDLLEKAVSR